MTSDGNLTLNREVRASEMTNKCMSIDEYIYFSLSFYELLLQSFYISSEVIKN